MKKLLSRSCLLLLLAGAPVMTALISSCGQQEETDPVMKTTRLNETPDTTRSKKPNSLSKEHKPKVESFQTNYPVDI